ncbi:hypothetical protein JTB14_005352 [Gonioctena quinquepunctata]|nr:hypothetical protein JTB14_005352 [Gonioctena quinquepunctata]
MDTCNGSPYPSCSELILYVNGKLCKADVKKLAPTTTLNTYLREHLHLTGTKRLCLEGGCGSCIVTVTRKNLITQAYEVLAVNSCLVSIFSCYGWEIQTIEGIGNSEKPHPLQSVITKFNGSQCGYCTPGMIMNMYSLTQAGELLTEKIVENSFGGNLCRCTGYRSILEAFKSTVDLDYPDIEDISKCSKTECCQCCSGSNSPVCYKPDEKCWIRVFKYIDLLEILKCFKNENRKYMLVAGNTAKGVYKSDPEPCVYVDIQNIPYLVEYKLKENELIMGGNISLSAAMKIFNEIAEENTGFAYLKKMSEHIDLIANVPVRNIGTLAGNLMIKHKHNDFPSDIFLILETIGATLKIVDCRDEKVIVTPAEF